MTLSDMETLSSIYERTGNVKSICVSLDSTEELFDKDRFFLYGKIKGQIQAKQKVFSYFDEGLSVEESM